MKTTVNQFAEQLQEMAAFATRNGLNPATDMDAIVSGWNQMAFNRAKAIEANKAKAIEIIKGLL